MTRWGIVDVSERNLLGDTIGKQMETAAQKAGGWENVILILDLDETLWSVTNPSETTFGSATWLADITEEYMNCIENVQKMILEVCDVIMGSIDVSFCCHNISELVEQWKSKGAKVIAATARMNSLQDGTQQQLETCGGLSFSDMNINVDEVKSRLANIWRPFWPDWPGLHYHNGIWYLSMADKGKFLEALLESQHLGSVFVDDSRHHLVSSVDALKHHVFHSAIHYTAACDSCKHHYCRDATNNSMAELVGRDLFPSEEHRLKILSLAKRNQFFRKWVANNVQTYPILNELYREITTVVS